MSECIECLDGAACGPRPRLRDIYKQLLASSVGSSAAVLALNPITVVKVHLQQSASSSIRSVVSRIYREKSGGGLRGFWAGTPVGLMQAVPNTVLYMSIYEYMKAAIASSVLPPSYASLSPGLAGGVARVFCVTVMSPLEVLRTMQTGGTPGSALEIVRSIHRQNGVKGFYRGWTSTIARDAPYSAIYWYAFDLMRPLWEAAFVPPSSSSASSASAFPSASASASPVVASSSTPATAFSNAATFSAGASASALAALVTHPFDVVKTRSQLAVAVPVPVDGSAARFSSGLAALYRAGGVPALYRGLSMRLATVIPGSAIVITVYEYLKANL